MRLRTLSTGVLVTLSVAIITTGLVAGGVAVSAPLVLLSDDMTNLYPNQASNHSILFTTLTGATQPSDTITLTFNPSFTLSALTAADIQLLHGPTGIDTVELTGPFAGVNTWGVQIASPVITLTHPTSGGDIPALDKITVRIGTNAGGVNQITNPSTVGSYVIRIGGTFGDTGALAVPIARATIGVSGGNGVTPPGGNNPPPTPPPTITFDGCPIFTGTYLLTGTTTIGTQVYINNDTLGVTQYPNGTWDSLRMLVIGPNTFYAVAQDTGNGIASTPVSATLHRRMLGDNNGDNHVNDFDLAGLASHWEQDWCPSDFVRDNIIDDFDLSVIAWYWTF